MRTRLDAELVRRGLARSRENAQDLIDRGLVRIAGLPATKPATQVDPQTSITVALTEDEYASRGGHKLSGALDEFENLVVAGKRALDAGASTGGFTDVLLRRGVNEVVAVDVGYGQLAWNLRIDPRVKVFDRVNVRDITIELIGGKVSLVVADLSFISLRTALPALARVSEADADLVLLVKPQFEVGRERLGAGGVVRERELRASAVRDVANRAYELEFGTLGVAASPLPGPAGNVEYFLWLRRAAPQLAEEMLEAALSKGPE